MTVPLTRPFHCGVMAAATCRKARRDRPVSRFISSREESFSSNVKWFAWRQTKSRVTAYFWKLFQFRQIRPPLRCCCQHGLTAGWAALGHCSEDCDFDMYLWDVFLAFVHWHLEFWHDRVRQTISYISFAQGECTCAVVSMFQKRLEMLQCFVLFLSLPLFAAPGIEEEKETGCKKCHGMKTAVGRGGQGTWGEFG